MLYPAFVSSCFVVCSRLFFGREMRKIRPCESTTHPTNVALCGHEHTVGVFRRRGVSWRRCLAKIEINYFVPFPLLASRPWPGSDIDHPTETGAREQEMLMSSFCWAGFWVVIRRPSCGKVLTCQVKGAVN